MAVFIIPGLLKKKDFYELLGSELTKAGFDTQIVDLGLNTQSLKDSAKKVLEHLKKTSGQDDIIAHSFGGIVLKYIIQQCPEIKEQIRSISFVSVPHGGSWQAIFISFLPAPRELLPFRKHFKELSKVWLPEATVNFISQEELKVWPRKSALLKDRIDIVIPGTDHDNIIRNENFIKKVIEFIKSGHDRVFI